MFLILTATAACILENVILEFRAKIYQCATVSRRTGDVNATAGGNKQPRKISNSETKP